MRVIDTPISVCNTICHFPGSLTICLVSLSVPAQKYSIRSTLIELNSMQWCRQYSPWCSSIDSNSSGATTLMALKVSPVVMVVMLPLWQQHQQCPCGWQWCRQHTLWREGIPCGDGVDDSPMAQVSWQISWWQWHQQCILWSNSIPHGDGVDDSPCGAFELTNLPVAMASITNPVTQWHPPWWQCWWLSLWQIWVGKSTPCGDSVDDSPMKWRHQWLSPMGWQHWQWHLL